ncbi:uncharacterized protein EAE98_001701 [Botrytis deweyae]|uniref:Uncharacterized protein n=1 Tax=Botrytis deweyae TaxID=2478750 RepID=A0ABQ7IYK8_9HELO|nr:uncharacterized protein EAE98_001701 [Botrytis deweyae]KAF7937387.1 hypothetical protein EAE98_001701 [Botrytis deweyae]
MAIYGSHAQNNFALLNLSAASLNAQVVRGTNKVDASTLRPGYDVYDKELLLRYGAYIFFKMRSIVPA